jgi:hypothetical protein
MTKPPVLTIAIATTRVRAASIDLAHLPADPRWRYTIFCQGRAPSLPSRSDISVVPVDGTGAARSRNAAIVACDTELLLFSDDDVDLIADGLARLLRLFADTPSLVLAAGRTKLPPGGSAKVYPEDPRRLTLFNSAKVGTVELAIRPAHVRAAGVRFDERFGAGTENAVGDEYIFIADCLRAGLAGGYWPITIAAHAGPSSGTDFASAAVTRARARVFERVFGPALSSLVKLGFIWRHRRRFHSFNEAWTFTRMFLPLHT